MSYESGAWVRTKRIFILLCVLCRTYQERRACKNGIRFAGFRRDCLRRISYASTILKLAWYCIRLKRRFRQSSSELGFALAAPESSHLLRVGCVGGWVGYESGAWVRTKRIFILLCVLCRTYQGRRACKNGFHYIGFCHDSAI